MKAISTGHSPWRNHSGSEGPPRTRTPLVALCSMSVFEGPGSLPSSQHQVPPHSRKPSVFFGPWPEATLHLPPRPQCCSYRHHPRTQLPSDWEHQSTRINSGARLCGHQFRPTVCNRPRRTPGRVNILSLSPGVGTPRASIGPSVKPVWLSCKECGS